MNEAQRQHEARVSDALRWVVQEAQPLVTSGGWLPKGSRLKCALHAAETAALKIDEMVDQQERTEQEKVLDAARSWVSREARGCLLMGVYLPAGSRLREAMAALRNVTTDLEKTG